MNSKRLRKGQQGQQPVKSGSGQDRCDTNERVGVSPTGQVELIAKLTDEEREQLEQCEATIRSGLQTFFDVGRALLAIRDQHLYRESHQTFERYCRVIWDMSRAHAYRLIGAAAIIQKLPPMDRNLVPECERQVRPLLKLDPALVPLAWSKALEKAGGGHVKFRDIEDAVGEILNSAALPSGGKVDRPMLKDLLLRDLRRLRKNIDSDAADAILEVIEHMRLLIEHYRGDTIAVDPSEKRV